MAKQRVKYRFDTEAETFVNPYNFVDIDFDRKSNADIERQGKTYTGWIDYRITTRSPMAIPDGASVTEETLVTRTREGEKKEKHPSYKFMTTPDGDFMVPGSSIRGVLRNVYETATDSCFSTEKEKQFITARQMSAGKPGILEIRTVDGKKEFSLFKADFYMLRVKKHQSFNTLNSLAWNDNVCPAYSVKQDENGKYIEAGGEKHYSGSRVCFRPLKDEKGKVVEYKKLKDRNNPKSVFPCGKIAKELTKDGTTGILVLGENIFGKHHERIFVKKGQFEDKAADKIENAYYGMLKTLDNYRDKGINKNYPGKHSGYRSFERMKKNGIIPVYYKWNGKNLYLQFAAVGRVAFNNDMVALTREKRPCKAKNDLCKACALFGMTGDDSLGSRLRFEDALIDKAVPYGVESRTLAELGSPRVAYMPFYSTMGKEADPNVVGYDDKVITIRGRKYYWHHEPKENVLNCSKTGRNATMEVLGKGAEFTGRIYFNDVTSEEIRELTWAINFWENDAQGDFCHKVGHGKPLGLGSCKLTVESINCRKFSEDDYTVMKGTFENNTLFDVSLNPFDDPGNTVLNLLDISNIHAMDERNVCYPQVLTVNDKSEFGNENDFAPHKWFTENKQTRNRSIMQTLPHINEDQSLYPVVAKIDSQGGNKSYKKGSDKRRNR